MRKIICFLLAVTLAVGLCVFSGFFGQNTKASALENSLENAVDSMGFLSGYLDDAEQQLQQEHFAFVTENQDRRSLMEDSYNYKDAVGIKKGDQLAAEYIVNRLKDFGFGYLDNNQQEEENSEDSQDSQQSSTAAQILLQYFEVDVTTDSGGIFTQAKSQIRWSQNVILRFDNKDTDNRIVLGASIDNNYSENNHGAMHSGGVAVLLYLSRVLYGNDLPFDLDIVFFGAGHFDSTPYYIGSRHYMESNNFGRIMLMVNLGRLGGEKTYVYSDEVKTDLLSYAVSLGDFSPLPLKNIPLLSPDDLGGPDGYVYSHYGMSGNNAGFMENGIPSLNIFCGDYGGLTLTDKEGSKNILKKDTLENMLTAYPDAYKKMADVFGGTIKIISNEQLPQLIQKSEDSRFDYSVFMIKWIAYLVFAALVLIGFVTVFNISRRLVQKYPPNSVAARQKPKSVFGDDYE